jgi:hypothetical protein
MADQGLLSGDKAIKYLSFKDKFYIHNLISDKRKWIFVARAVCITISLAIAISFAVTAAGLPRNNIQCFEDKLFEASAAINTYFSENASMRHLLLIFSSSLIDFQFVYFCVNYLLWGNTARPIVFLIIFYSFRAFIQSIFFMKYPEGMAWEYPGIPSLTVSYEATSDFFFSGHVGIMVFVSLENYKHRNYQMMTLGIFSVCAEFFVMLVLRGHYSIDLISGIIFGHYFWLLSGKATKKIENFIKKKELLYEKDRQII